METTERARTTLTFDFGTFEGFNFRSQSAIERILTANEVVNWNHDRQGEAEFWPSGDNQAVALIFQHRSFTNGFGLVHLDRLLSELGTDSVENFIRIHYAVNISGCRLDELTAAQVEDNLLHIFFGTSFIDLRREAAFELFESYYPEEYKVWEKSHCDGLIFDTDHFLNSPCFSVEEIELNGQVALAIAPQ